MTLPENIDIHLFRNREGKWVIRVPIEAVSAPPHRAGQTHYYTQPAETPNTAFVTLAFWLREPSDFSEKEWP